MLIFIQQYNRGRSSSEKKISLERMPTLDTAIFECLPFYLYLMMTLGSKHVAFYKDKFSF